MAVAAVIALLGIGAVGAYAGLADDTTPPVTTSNAVATYWNDAVIHLTATDAEGVAYMYNELDNGVARLYTVNGGAPETDAPHAWYHPLKPGTHTLKYWSQDVNGNVEARHTVEFAVRTDTAAPVTTATGATDGGWYRQTVNVSLAATDPTEGIGVSSLQYALDGAAPTVVAAASAAVPIAVDAATENGPHKLTYKATDALGNVEALKTLTVNVDTRPPTTSAPSAASVIKGRKASLKYKVTDRAPNGGKATVVIKIRSRSGKIVKTLGLGSVGVNSVRTARFTCKLRKGTYKYLVYATDLAGNKQARIGSNQLVVK